MIRQWLKGLWNAPGGTEADDPIRTLSPAQRVPTPTDYTSVGADPSPFWSPGRLRRLEQQIR